MNPQALICQTCVCRYGKDEKYYGKSEDKYGYKAEDK